MCRPSAKSRATTRSDSQAASPATATTIRIVAKRRKSRRFLLPTYEAWHELAHSYGRPVLDMDSDGEVSELIPLWIEAGINVSDPMEVAAGNDIGAARQRWGKRMAFKGGLDKRALAAGGAVMRAELERVVPPLLAGGGFIPSCDHGVPPDISWPVYLEYSRYLAQLTGWL